MIFRYVTTPANTIGGVLEGYNVARLTLRYAEPDDFEMVFTDDISSWLSKLKRGTVLMCVRPATLLYVISLSLESVKGVYTLTVRGKSMEHLLDGKICAPNANVAWTVSPAPAASLNLTPAGTLTWLQSDGATADSKNYKDREWILPTAAYKQISSYTIGELITYCLDGSYSPRQNVIAHLDVLKAGGILRRPMQIPRGYLGPVVRQLLAIDQLGLRSRKSTTKLAIIQIYEGRDRSDTIVFNEDFGDFDNMSYVLTSENEYHSGVLMTKYFWKHLKNPYITHTASDTDLFRKTLFVENTSINWISPGSTGDTGIDARLSDILDSPLRKAVQKVSFDMQTSDTARYVYETDYFLGDIVGVKARYYEATKMRVVEVTLIDDEHGTQLIPLMEEVE